MGKYADSNAPGTFDSTREMLNFLPIDEVENHFLESNMYAYPENDPWDLVDFSEVDLNTADWLNDPYAKESDKNIDDSSFYDEYEATLCNENSDSDKEEYDEFTPKDDLDEYVQINQLDEINYTGSDVVARVIKAVATAMSFQEPVMRAMAYELLLETEKTLLFVEKNQLQINGAVPSSARAWISPFPNLFKGYPNGALKKINQAQVEKLLFGVYAPICRVVGKRYFPVDKFILQMQNFN